MPRNTSKLVADMRAIWDTADKAGRDLTMSERTEVEGLLEGIKAQKRIEDLGRELGAGMEFMRADGAPASAYGLPGDVFVRSEGYRSVKNSSARGQTWTTGLVDVGLQAKGTLLEGAGSPGPARAAASSPRRRSSPASSTSFSNRLRSRTCCSPGRRPATRFDMRLRGPRRAPPRASQRAA